MYPGGEKPVSRKMEGNMQTIFTKKISKQNKYDELIEKKEKEKKLQDIKVQRDLEKEEASFPFTQEEVQDKIQQYDNQKAAQNTTTRKPSFKRVKSFKEMTITERLEYLLNFPKQLPPVPCIVITINENVRGFVTALDGEKVELKLMDQTLTTINVHTIQEVKMIGI